MFYNFIFFARIVGAMGTDLFLLINLFLVASMCVLKGRLRVKRSFFYLVATYLLISLIPVILFGFSTKLYAGYLIRLITAYLIIIYFGSSFLNVFKNLVFVLAYLSIPLFLIQISWRNAFSLFDTFTNRIIFDDYKNLNAVYIFIFYINPAGELRNSGFMSEPSSYGAMLAWAMLFNLHMQRFKLDARTITMFIAAITTFSIGTYLYLLLIILLILYSSVSGKFTLIFIRSAVIISFTIPILYFIPVFSTNIEMMEQKLQQEDSNYQRLQAGELDEQNISRISGARINLKYFKEWPFGYGLVPLSDTKPYLGQSPNGLSNIIVKWGVGALIILVTSAFRLYKTLSVSSNFDNRYIKFLTMFIYLLPLSGYSYFNQPMILALFLWPIFIKSRTKLEQIPSYNSRLKKQAFH